MKKIVSLITAASFVAALTGVSFAGGYERKVAEVKTPVAEAPAAPASSGSVVYDESSMNKNLGGAGATTVEAGKTSGDVFTGFMKECGIIAEGVGKTTGEVTVGAAKTTGECLKGFADSCGKMLFGAGESSARVADNTGKIVAGEGEAAPVEAKAEMVKGKPETK